MFAITNKSARIAREEFKFAVACAAAVYRNGKIAALCGAGKPRIKVGRAFVSSPKIIKGGEVGKRLIHHYDNVWLYSFELLFCSLAVLILTCGFIISTGSLCFNALGIFCAIALGLFDGHRLHARKEGRNKALFAIREQQARIIPVIHNNVVVEAQVYRGVSLNTERDDKSRYGQSAKYTHPTFSATKHRASK